MFCKMPINLFAVAVLFCLILVSVAEAQLNFSTGWGKRSQDVRVRSGTDCSSQSTSSLEQLLKLYTFIQIEAQRILDCRNLNK